MMGLIRLNSEEGEYFHYRRAAKFISEILIAISTIVVISASGTLISFAMDLRKADGNTDKDSGEESPQKGKDIKFAMFIYTIVVLIVGLSDIVFALILRFGIRKLKISYCLFWRGATMTSLIVVGMLTLAFVTMISNPILILGYLPSLVSKPFSLWIVNAFIHELGELRTFPYAPSTAVPPAKPSFSLDDVESMKRTTTVFHMKRKFGVSRKQSQKNPYIITSKLGSIPEAE